MGSCVNSRARRYGSLSILFIIKRILGSFMQFRNEYSNMLIDSTSRLNWGSSHCSIGRFQVWYQTSISLSLLTFWLLEGHILSLMQGDYTLGYFMLLSKATFKRFIHTFTWSQPCKATASSSGAVRVGCLAQGFNRGYQLVITLRRYLNIKTISDNSESLPSPNNPLETVSLCSSWRITTHARTGSYALG